MEAIIQAALGETNVDTSGIVPPTTFEVHIAVTGYAMDKLGLSQAEIDQFIVDAENCAFERGWHPPLASPRFGLSSASR